MPEYDQTFWSVALPQMVNEIKILILKKRKLDFLLKNLMSKIFNILPIYLNYLNEKETKKNNQNYASIFLTLIKILKSFIR